MNRARSQVGGYAIAMLVACSAPAVVAEETVSFDPQHNPQTQQLADELAEQGVESCLVAVPRQVKESLGSRQPGSAASLAEAPQYSSRAQQFFCSPSLLSSDGYARYMPYRIIADPDGDALDGKRGAKPGSDGKIEEAFKLSPRSKPGLSDRPCVRIGFEENVPFEPALEPRRQVETVELRQVGQAQDFSTLLVEKSGQGYAGRGGRQRPQQVYEPVDELFLSAVGRAGHGLSS